MPFGDAPPSARAGYQGPIGTSVVGPYAGKKGLSFGDDNAFRVGENQEVRVLDAGGNVIFSGSGVEGAKRAVAVGQSISDDLGKDANFKIQTGERTINPDGRVGGTRYIDVAYAAPKQSGLGFLMDNVLPFAAAFIPGVGPILGAALGSAASSAVQGRGLEDALKRAAIAGGSAYAGGQLFGPATSGATPTPGGNIASVATPAIPTGAFDGILVNATRAVAPSLVGSAVGGALGSGLSGVTGSNPPASQSNEIVVTGAQRPTIPAGAFDGILGVGGLGGLAAATAGGGSGASSNVVNGVDQATGNIVVSGSVPGAAPIPAVIAGLGGIPAITGGALTPTQTAGTPPGNGGVLGTGLTLTQLLSIGGIGADLLGSLIGGSGGAGAGTPYVSPFGTGTGLAPRQDMRANPNITDYERYGFGPEAMFFRPEYSGLLSANASASQAPAGMTTNPALMPLI